MTSLSHLTRLRDNMEFCRRKNLSIKHWHLKDFYQIKMVRAGYWKFLGFNIKCVNGVTYLPKIWVIEKHPAHNDKHYASKTRCVRLLRSEYIAILTSVISILEAQEEDTT